MRTAKNASTPLSVRAAEHPLCSTSQRKSRFDFDQYMDACEVLCKYEFIDRVILDTMVTEFHTRKISERAFKDKYSNYADLADAIVIAGIR